MQGGGHFFLVGGLVGVPNLSFSVLVVVDVMISLSFGRVCWFVGFRGLTSPPQSTCVEGPGLRTLGLRPLGSLCLI